MRNNADTVFKAWYASAIDLGSDLGTKPSISRTASRQRHRENTPHDSRKNITVGPCLFLSLTISRKRCHQACICLVSLKLHTFKIKLLLIKTAVQLLGLVPSIIVTRENTNIEEMSEMYQSDLPSPWTLDIEYDRWSRKWKSKLTKPDSLQQ
ncbi:unnamed protein product [Porites lobata]|uniref:Uncharacterized protein n=1 Tax=Porites lobata TaxID=104759 RepID=A0ABN8ND27_9CNID|nr:unnamed protein product [Porites lobata]